MRSAYTAASLPVAEMVKLADNSRHALKVAYSNEIGRAVPRSRSTARPSSDIFKSDRRLNISTAYLAPGYAFGGSCLPKDLRAQIAYRARRAGVSTPVLDAILPSNREQVEAALRAIESYQVRRGAIRTARARVKGRDRRSA